MIRMSSPATSSGFRLDACGELLVADRRAGSWRTGRGACAGRGSPARAQRSARACRTSSRRRRRTGTASAALRQLERRLGQRVAVRLVGGAADQRVLGLEASGRARFSTRTACGDDLGADAVTGQDWRSSCVGVLQSAVQHHGRGASQGLLQPGARPRRRGSCRRGAGSGRCRRSR